METASETCFGCGTLPGSKNDPRYRVNVNSHPDASSAYTRIAGLKCQRARRATLRGKRASRMAGVRRRATHWGQDRNPDLRACESQRAFGADHFECDGARVAVDGMEEGPPALGKGLFVNQLAGGLVDGDDGGGELDGTGVLQDNDIAPLFLHVALRYRPCLRRG